MDVSLEPLDEFVVVQPVSDEAETRAGLILPASATEAAPCRTGIVTAIGADVTGVDAGDKVLYPRDAGFDVRLGGLEVKVLKREDLIARIAWIVVWLIVAYRVVQRNDLSVAAKVLWIVLILIFPLVGLLVYFLWDAARPSTT